MPMVKDIVVECCYCRAQAAARSLTTLAVNGWRLVKQAHSADALAGVNWKRAKPRDYLGWCEACSRRFDVKEG